MTSWHLQPTYMVVAIISCTIMVTGLPVNNDVNFQDQLTSIKKQLDMLSKLSDLQQLRLPKQDEIIVAYDGLQNRIQPLLNPNSGDAITDLARDTRMASRHGRDVHNVLYEGETDMKLRGVEPNSNNMLTKIGKLEAEVEYLKTLVKDSETEAPPSELKEEKQILHNSEQSAVPGSVYPGMIDSKTKRIIQPDSIPVRSSDPNEDKLTELSRKLAETYKSLSDGQSTAKVDGGTIATDHQTDINGQQLEKLTEIVSDLIKTNKAAYLKLKNDILKH